MHPTETIDRDSLRDDIPEFRPGDTVKVHVRVVEGNRERVQVFQGAVMRRQGGGVQETFTVRKVSFGVGVERTFPVHSPTIAKIEVTRWVTCGGPSSTTCATGTGRRPRSRSAVSRRGKAASAVAAVVEEVEERELDDDRRDRRRGRRCHRGHGRRGGRRPPTRRKTLPRGSRRVERRRRMSEEDLERYESEIELGLVQEYRAVLPVFTYVIETERRFYLANDVSLNVRSDTTPACIELELRDAWVWDMYRPARFVPEVRVVTFRDVNIERLPEQEL